MSPLTNNRFVRGIRRGQTKLTASADVKDFTPLCADGRQSNSVNSKGKSIMSKFRTMFFSIIASGILLSLSSTIASAQRPNPSAQRVAQARAQGPCRDPWITIAIWEKFASTRQPNGVGDLQECSPALYNGGSWSSYDQLYRAVDQTLNGLSSNGISFSISVSNGIATLGTLANGVTIGRGTTRVVAQGAGNVVAQGAGNLITQDGAGLVSHDGGGFVVGGYALQSISDACKKVSIGGGKYFVVRRCR
jgi:hypothetical protein